MAYIVSKPTRREAEQHRRESLARQGLNPKRYRGIARRLDEAHDAQRQLEREGEAFDRLWVVSGESPEAKRAHEDLMVRQGVNPDTMEPLR